MTSQVMTPSDIEQMMGEANALIRKGDLGEAQALFRRGLVVKPGDPAIAHGLALTLHLDGRSSEAEKVLSELKAFLPETFVLRGEIYDALGRTSEAFRSFKDALRVSPQSYDAFMKLGALKEKMGDKPGARDCYRSAMEIRPLDWNATTQYILAIWDKEPDAAAKIAEQLLGAATNVDERLRALQFFICRNEWAQRIRNHQMPYHATSVDELFFQYSAEYVKEFEALAQKRFTEEPTNPSRISMLATARFCLNNRHGAEEMWNAIAAKTVGSIGENVRFAPAFYDELRKFTDADLTRGLPPLIEIAPIAPAADGVLYLSCNFIYFRAFALPMIVSAHERSPQTPIHVHIMDANEAETALSLAFLQRLAPLRFSLTVERPGLQTASSKEARSYYHAVRFIRYYQHLKQYNCPLWLMDVDAIVNIDLKELFDQLKGFDVSMRIRPGRMEPWNQFNACIVGASMSAPSVEYIRLTAAYLAYFFQRKSLRWGIDQLAMYGVFADMQDRGEAPSMALLGEREVDYDYRDDGFVWCNSGAGKFKHLQRISNPGSMPTADFDGNRFVGVFEHFWNETQRIAADVGING